MLNITFIQTLYNKSETLRKKKETLLTELKKRIIDFEQKPGDILKLSKKSINHCVNERTKDAQKDLKWGCELIWVSQISIIFFFILHLLSFFYVTFKLVDLSSVSTRISKRIFR